jgi:hypothetical protein
MLKQVLINLFLITLSLCENYYIQIGEKQFPFTLEDNSAANKLKEKMSIKLKMSGDINHEKYYQFSDTFPTDTYSPGTIETGDILLYQNDYLVLFYETFTTSYSYTRLGKVTSTNGLKEALGSGDVTVNWCKDNCSDLKDDEKHLKYNFVIILFFILVF